MRFLLVLLFVCSCTTTRPYIHGVDPGDTDQAFQLMVKRLPEIYPDIPQAGALGTLRSLDITFSEEDRQDSEGDSVAGMTYFPRAIWIKSNERYPDASKNALIHECVHVLLWRYYLDPDGNHAGPGGMWTKGTDIWVVSVMQELQWIKQQPESMLR